MPLVEIPNVGEVEFPDDMSHDDIATAIQRDIIRAPMPSVPPPGGAVSLSPDPNISTLPTAFPVQEARVQANIAAQTPELSPAEAGQMLTTPYAQVPQTLVQAPALRAAQALLPGQAGEVAGQVATGAANLTKGAIEQALMTPASGPLGVAAMVPGVREAVGLGASALAAKAAGDKLGEFAATKDPQALTEGVGLAVMAALGGTATGMGISRSQPREFLRALIDENRSAKEIPVELVREPRPSGTQQPPPQEPVQRPAIEEGGQRLLVGPEEAKLTAQQRALLEPEAVRQLTEGDPNAIPQRPLAVEEVQQQAPTIPQETVTLYRATSPTVKFKDVFKGERLKQFEHPDKSGEFWTSDPKYADYFRESYGKDAVIESITLPKAEAEAFRVSPIEFKVPQALKSPAPRPQVDAEARSQGAPEVPQETMIPSFREGPLTKSELPDIIGRDPTGTLWENRAPSTQEPRVQVTPLMEQYEKKFTEAIGEYVKRNPRGQNEGLVAYRERLRKSVPVTAEDAALLDKIIEGLKANRTASLMDLRTEKSQQTRNLISNQVSQIDDWISSYQKERERVQSTLSSSGPPSPQALGLVPPVPQVVKDMAGAVGSALDWYSEPLTERLATSGGPTAKGFSNMAKEIVHRSKALYGSITPVLDPALEATGALNRSTTWLNDIAPTTQPWGYRNAVAAVEGPMAAVPADYQATVQKLKDANLEIGRLAQTGVPGFVASGKYQRQPTAFLIDTIRTGKGPAHDLLVKALSTENRIPQSKVRSVLLDTKAELDAPGSKQTIHRIAQEFERHFKKFPTDLKISTGFGDVWMPILHAKPFNYLSHAALATAQRVAFLERIPQGTLDQLRQQVTRELKDPAAFDDLVRALHGLSIDEPWKLAAPGSTVGMLASGANRVLTDVFGALKLSASALTNIPETIIGNTPAFMGWRNFLEGAATLPRRHADLEALGAINRAIYNWSLDRNAPVRTLLATFRNGMRKATLQQVFNELQEKLAASAAQVLAERARGRSLSDGEQNAMIETAVAMGFERPAARALAIGHATPEQYQDFVRRAPTFLTGGNQMMAETSRLGANRLFSAAFRFQSYPQMKLNSFRKAWGNFADAIEAGDSKRVRAASSILSKFLFNTTAQGAGAAFLAALFAGRKGGVVVTTEDALEGPGAFFLDSVMAGMGGPAAAIHYALSSGRLRDKLDPRNINLGSVFPGAIYLELKQMFNREGVYAGMTLTEAAEKYAQSKVPAGRVIYRALRAAGLLDSADDSTAELYQRIRLWRDKSENPKVARQKEERQGVTFGESAYASLRQALKANDRARSIEAYRELVKTRDRDVVRRAMEASRPFTGSWETERLFRASLDADGRELYRKAQQERDRLAARFRAFIP